MQGLFNQNNQNMKTDLKIKGNQLINERDRITNELFRMWNIIVTENIVKKGTVRNYDMKEVLIRIKALYEQSVIVKLRIQCANMGMKFRDLPKDANIINIYRLSAYNEYCVKLNDIIKKHTINPIVKIKKGKKALTVTEELTNSYLSKELNNYLIECNKLRKAIADFNENVDLTDDQVPLFLVA